LSCKNTPITWPTTGLASPQSTYFKNTSYSFFSSATERNWNLSDAIINSSVNKHSRTDCGPIVVQILNFDLSAIDTSVFQHDTTAKTFHIGLQGMQGTATSGTKKLSAFFMFEYGAGGPVNDAYTPYMTNRRDFDATLSDSC
jgi:hypothetical protein